MYFSILSFKFHVSLSLKLCAVIFPSIQDTMADDGRFEFEGDTYINELRSFEVPGPIEYLNSDDDIEYDSDDDMFYP